MTAVSPPTDLAREVRALADELHPRTHPVAVKVRLAGTGPALATCEVWTGDSEVLWVHRADLPAAVGQSMLDVERALVAAGYVYALAPSGRPRWRYDANRGGIYTLEITRPW